MNDRGIEMAAFCGVVKDGELKTSKSGNSYGIVTLMTDSGQSDESGKSVPVFLKVRAFGPAAAVAANLRKGQRAYCEGQLSLGMWQPDSGPPKLDLSVKAFKLEATQIGRNRPPAAGQKLGEPFKPIDHMKSAHQQAEFADEIPF